MKPVPSSGFGYDPIAMSSLVRKFYERWHAQGGQSARDCCGIMRRAANYRDVRTDQDRMQWENLEWRLSRCRADMRMKEVGEMKKVNVIPFPVSQR